MAGGAGMSTYLSLAEAATEVRLSKDTLRSAIYLGSLRAKKSGAGGGGRFIIRRADLDAWFESLPDA